MKSNLHSRIGALTALTAILGLGVFVACSDDDTATTNTATADAGKEASTTGDTGSTCAPVAEKTCSISKCTAQNGGEPSICVADQCVKLKDQGCAQGETFGEFNDDSFVFGVMLPRTGPNAEYNVPIVAGLKLAMEEVNATGGVPTSADACVPKRKLGFVWCDSDIAPPAIASPAATHLTSTLKVPLVVGSYASGHTLPIAKNYTIPNKIMQFSPASTSPLITDPSKNTDPLLTFNASPDGTRLFWRTAVSDAAQSVAVNAIYGQIETELKAAAVTPIKLAFLNKADPYGRGMIAGFENGLKVDGAATKAYLSADGQTVADATGNYFKREFNVNLGAETPFPDGGAGEGPELNQIVAQLKIFKPSSIVLIGTAESLSLIRRYEEAVDADGTLPKPRWILVDGQRANDLFKIVADHPTLRTRIRGAVSGVPSQLQTDLELRFKKRFPDLDPRAYGVPQAYDLGYAVSLALASTKGVAVDGTVLAKGMANLVGGSQVTNFSPPSLTAAFQTLVSGQKVKINGTSGPLQFDLAIGEAISDYSIWCVKPNGATFAFNDITGSTYSAAEKALKGTFSCE